MLELGGKSPNIILDDADFSTAIPMAVAACYLNDGLACIAASRLIVPEDRLDVVTERPLVQRRKGRIDRDARGGRWQPVLAASHGRPLKVDARSSFVDWSRAGSIAFPLASKIRRHRIIGD
jgi:hypothetical protein